MTNRLISANEITLPIIADASPDMHAAIELMLEGYEILEIPHDTLTRQNRCDLLILREYIISI
jgi:hypothetical protein